MNAHKSNGRMRKSAMAAIALGLLFGGAAAAGEVLSLAGDWQFRRDDQKAGVQGSSGSPLRWPAARPSSCPARWSRRNSAFPIRSRRRWPASTARTRTKAVAWYERQIEIPETWRGKRITLFLERVRWVSRRLARRQAVGEPQDSLIAPHVYDCSGISCRRASIASRSASTTRRRSTSARSSPRSTAASMAT